MSDESRPRILAGTAMGQELYRTEDEYGPVVVYQRGDRRIMSFGSSLEQSSISMSRPWYLMHEYTQIMLLGLLFAETKHITVLGLGGGGLAHCLYHFFPQKIKNFVELRQSVIDTAREWFELPENENLKVVCADAFEFLRKQRAGRIGLILSDLYEAEGMSATQAQVEFVEHSYQALSSNGWLVLNFHEQPTEGSQLMQVLNEKFEELYVCDVYSGNRVMFCGKQASIYDKAELKARAQQLARQTDMSLYYYYRQLRNISS